jgi:hypothetical protein
VKSTCQLCCYNVHVCQILQLTQAIKTCFGNPVFGSLTLTKANCTFPSEKSSIKSTSSPSVRPAVSTSNGPQTATMGLRTSSALHLQNTLLPASILLESIHQWRRHREESPLPVGWRACCGAAWCRGIDHALVGRFDGGAIRRGVERGHGQEGVASNSWIV